jgi:hypothetical protein
MENIIFLVYIIGCLVAFLFVEHETRDIENADTSMMSFFATGSWLIVLVIVIIKLKDYIKTNTK